MYYLLEDNRIIYDEEILNEYKKRGNFNNLKTKINKNELQLIYINDKDISCTIHRVGNIKKQSENVFDLIEVGDLIASYRYSIEGRTEEKEINSVDELFTEENGVGINQCCIVDFEDICAIYKSDSKENYIKVWEKKDKDENNT